MERIKGKYYTRVRVRGGHALGGLWRVRGKLFNKKKMQREIEKCDVGYSKTYF